MKKAIIPILTAAISMTLFTACHHDSLEDRAERDARDYTERYCPTPFTDNQRTDSITFTRADKTFHYFYTLRDEADNAEIINQHKATMDISASTPMIHPPFDASSRVLSSSILK